MNVLGRTVVAPLLAGFLVAGATFVASAQQNPARAAVALFASGDIKAAKDALLACADAGDAECQFLLAQKIEEGKHYVRNLGTARKLYELSYQGGFERSGPHLLRLVREAAEGGPRAAAQTVSPAQAHPAAVQSASPVPVRSPAAVKPSQVETAAPRDSAAPASTLGPASTTYSDGTKKSASPPPRRSYTTTARDLLGGNGPPSPARMATASNYELCVFQAILQELPREAEVVATRRDAARELGARGEGCEPAKRYQSAAAAEIRALGGVKPSKGVRALSIISDIVGAVGAGMSSGSRRVQGQTSSYDAKDCSSDYSCQVGQQCVKPPGRLTGQCMTTVKASGVPTFRVPRSSSLGPDTTPQCAISTDCPIGFQCDVTLKACIKR